MGRGLSDLQKLALTLAYENDAPNREQAYAEAEKVEQGELSPRFFIDCRQRQTEDCWINNPHYHDGLRHWYRVTTSDLYHFNYGIPWSDYRWKGQPTFTIDEVTAAMRTCVSKALRRLCDRGLMVNARGYGSGGYCLTPEGVAKAESLMGN